MGPRRSQVAFWRLFPHLAFKREHTRKSTRGHRGSTGGLQEVYMRMLRVVLKVLKVSEWVEEVYEGWDEVLGRLGSTKDH